MHHIKGRNSSLKKQTVKKGVGTLVIPACAALSEPCSVRIELGYSIPKTAFLRMRQVE